MKQKVNSSGQAFDLKMTREVQEVGLPIKPISKLQDEQVIKRPTSIT